MSSNILNKVHPHSILSNIFSFISKEKSIKIAQINNKLLSSLNLKIDDYYVDRKYQKIILKSKGDINIIFDKVNQLYKNEDLKDIPFTELSSKIIKYLKYLYAKKYFTSFKLKINGNNTHRWAYFLFTIEIIRQLKYGLCLQISPKVNYKYYEIIKDSIYNLGEIKSIYFHSFKVDNNKSINKNYIELFDWTKAKCLNFSEMISRNYYIQDNLNIIPIEASFNKLKIDENNVHIRKIENFLSLHANHIEHLKIINFAGVSENIKVFHQFNKLKCLKLIKCQNLTLFNFLSLFKNTLTSIKKLFLDNLNESINDISSYINNNYNNFINILKNLTILEKLDISINSTKNPNKIYKILSIIVSLNQNLKLLKITILKEPKTENNKNKNIPNYINFDSQNSKTRSVLEKQIEKYAEEQDEFLELIKAISSLRNLSYLQLKINMDYKMTNTFNNFFNVGDSLRSLEIIHSGNLDMTRLFISHPNLDDINFTLICKENDIKVENDDKRFKNNNLRDYEYDFPQRSWKKIVLNYYPVNDTLINALTRFKKSIRQLKLNKTINVSKKSNKEIYNYLLEILNNNNN